MQEIKTSIVTERKNFMGNSLRSRYSVGFAALFCSMATFLALTMSCGFRLTDALALILVAKEQDTVLIISFIFFLKRSFVRAYAKGLKAGLKTIAVCGMVFNKGKFEHVTPLLVNLQWLPIKQRTVFRNLGNYAVQGTEWTCTCDLLDRYVPTRSLRSSNQFSLKVRSTNTVLFGGCAFSVAAPKLWNSVLFEIRSAENLN